ncbi:MAG: DNA methyltransferase [Gemmobacter sp.]
MPTPVNAARQNQLYYGDNLDVLRRKIPDASVDLCYIDPPFNSKRNYFQIYNNVGAEDRAQAQAFVDTWEWGDEAKAGLDWITDIAQLQSGKLTEQTVDLIRGLEKVLKRGSLLAYLIHMTLRIVEIHRVLKPTGSFYLHCDPTASHYLKLVCDTIFVSDQRGGDFINEIIWWYKRWSGTSSSFQRMHDVILFYAKNKHDRVFNVQYQAYAKPEAIEKTIRGKVDGKLVRLKDKDGNYIERKKENKGVAAHDVFKIEDEPENPDVFELQHIQPTAKERLGYPTQKPESLLERIIKSSSNEGDTVLDAYCGCGTTVAVAQRLNRRWIGIDITYQSISLILKRLADKYPDTWPQVEANILLDGVPRDIASARALANRRDDKTRKEFEKWAILTYSANQARINEKKGADAGIDGIAYFLIDKDKNGKAIFQVKSGGANRATLATLNSDRLREGADFGFLITLDPPTKAMKDEIAAAGKYRHPLLNREDDRIQVITVEDILNGAKLDLPMARSDAVKSAKAVDGIGQSDMGF